MGVLMMPLEKFICRKSRSRQSRKLSLMSLSKLLFVSSLYLVSCQTIQIPEIRPGITLPASGDGYRVNTVTGADETVPSVEWRAMLPRAIILFSDDWATLKTITLNNCMRADSCARAVGVLDSLFQTIDQALRKMPKL